MFGGFGFINMNSTVDNYDGTLFKSGKNNGFSFPIGAGASLKLSKAIDLNIEYGQHVTGRDKEMDFVSFKNKDQYSYASAGLTFKFLPKDVDNDGIRDKDDQCIDTPGKIELAGCPDKDNDGIADKDDACPDVAGKAEFKGCPDTDGDGIPDKDDKCPTEAGKKELGGCPDKDGDGVADKDDKCPDQAGKKELAGCPDRDGDGIADNDDVCPDVAGLAKFKGCPDKDGDGVPDKDDKCPEIAGTVANNGCPEETKALIDKIVYFNTDEAIVIASYNQLLYEVIEMMKDNPGVKIKVDGHADERGTVEYNMKLSERRADYVIKFLAKKGIDKSRIIKNFYGKSRPASDNSTVEGMRLNRRVEIQSIK
jgi:outer membrane protein OmpA-like peptidoglycan-associated protein